QLGQLETHGLSTSDISQDSFPTKSSMEIPVFSVPETKKEEIEPEKEILKKIESVPSTSKNSEIIDIPEPILKKYNLSTESNPSQLCVYASELGAMLPDWKARKNVKEALRRRQFKEEQIKALVPDKRNEKLTIRERVQYCAKSGDPYDIYLHALDLVKTKNDSDEEIVASSSRISLFRKELKESGVDSKVIDIYAKFPALTQDSNEIQKKQLPKNNDLSKEVHREHYNPFDTQLAEIDSMLAEM
ncbi:19818_t:CDS:2, partial [Entrophospora sp. SA101]